MAKSKPREGAQFLHYFGPLLDALRSLGGSGTPDEVVERIAADLHLPDDLQNELLPSGAVSESGGLGEILSRPGGVS